MAAPVPPGGPMNPLAGRAVISGAGQSQVGRRLGRDGLELTLEACLRAIGHAGLTPADIDGVATYPGPISPDPGFSGGGAGDVIGGLGIRARWYLGAMETAGQLVDDEEAREAMKDSGIGTPATRAAIIERLIDVGYVERDGRALVVTEKGLNVIRLLDGHQLTSPSLTGDWEHKLGQIESGEVTRKSFMDAIAGFAKETVEELDGKLKDVRIPRANLGPCPVCGRDITENRKGFSCWSKDDPGCGFVIWKSKAGKTLPAAVARELVKTGRTAKPVTGFKSRAGRNFRARLALHQTEEGKWRVEFDEPWAQDGLRAPAGEGDGVAATDAAAPADSSAAA